MQFLAEYGMFLAKIMTWVIAILAMVGGIIVIVNRGGDRSKDKLEVKKLNEKYREMADAINAEMLTKEEYKRLTKEIKKTEKAQAKVSRKRLFILDFNGDIKASAVRSLREEITAVLSVATPADEVVVCLESGGGLVNAYGLAASQLQRVKQNSIPLTVIIDKIAASGGYLMACVADHLFAAPFAVIGSVGVLAQLPNFHRFLKKHDVDFEQITAGEYKRTLSIFGENTDKSRKKFQEELEEIHIQFKNFVAKNRPQMNMDQIATGEHWLAHHALELKLVDKLITSDDYLLQASQYADLYQITYSYKLGLSEKVFSAIGMVWEKLSSFKLKV